MHKLIKYCNNKFFLTHNPPRVPGPANLTVEHILYEPAYSIFRVRNVWSTHYLPHKNLADYSQSRLGI